MTPVFEGASGMPTCSEFDLSPCFAGGFIRVADYGVREGRGPAALAYGASLLRLAQYGAICNSAFRTSETSMAIAGAAGRNERPV